MSTFLHQTPRLGTMLIFSSLLHLLVIVGGGSWKLAPSYRLTFGPVYEVKLVDRVPFTPMTYGEGLEGISNLGKTGNLSVRREAVPIPIKRLEKEAHENPEVKKALEDIRKKTAQENVGVPPSSASSHQLGPHIINEYLKVMWEKVRSEWILPPGIVASDRWEAIVHLRVLKNGKLVDIKMERSSGNAYFDRSVLRAVQKADPLPPFPPGLREESIEVGIRFHSQEAFR
ncbi:MAG: TonB C-terminal domain-containing protein [Syntrophales bacterium]|nr:TonB C-terminal domain-containing protein [Syntrophales bacterium]